MRSTGFRAMFHPPTDYYYEELAPLDDQLCALIAKRKELSGNNPGFPGVDRISVWCRQYGLNEHTILSVFHWLYNEDRFLPPPVPTGFRRFIPIAKFVEADGVIYAVTHMKQYTNMSVVNIEVSLETDDETAGIMHAQAELSIGSAYKCWHTSGVGNDRGMQYGFTVTPPLPDDTEVIEFSLRLTPGPDIPAKPRISLKTTEITIK